MMKVYKAIAQKLNAIKNCRESANHDWEYKHIAMMDEIVKNHMPSGSGFDSGTKLSDASTEDKLIFLTSFHHMNENGMYDGWTDHEIIITPSMSFDFNIKVRGKNVNDIKGYIVDVFDNALNTEIIVEMKQ